MIKRNNHDEIMAYIAKNDFCDEAEIALTRRGNDEEIRAYSVSD